MKFGLSKGLNGKVAVMGGSAVYSGAPFYSGISALKSGADLAFVLTSKSAAQAIKSYSSQLIVHPVWDQTQLQNQEHLAVSKGYILKHLACCDSLVVGPGLGRSSGVARLLQQLFPSFQERLKIVLDADALFHLTTQSIALPKNLIILTPNLAQSKYVFQYLKSREPVQKQNVIVLEKGATDRIHHPLGIQEIDFPGSPKRCGGLGDILAGVIAALIVHSHSIQTLALACRITRRASQLAFNSEGRGTTALDAVQQLSKAWLQLDKPKL